MPALLAALALAGCGGGGGSRSAAATATATEPAPAPTATATAPATATARTETASGGSGGAAAPSTTTPTASPERRQGGAGDEIPARSQALITGRAGRLTPRTVRVLPFIAIRVQLRSADGAPYALRGGGRTLRVGGPVSSRGVTFAGLRTGARLVLRGPQGTVVVVADAEAGP